MVWGLCGLMSDVFYLKLFPCLSLCTNQLHSVLGCILPPLFFSLLTLVFPPSPSPKASLSPDRLAGDKTQSLGEERDIWEQDGKGDGGHIPTWSPSSGSVETIVTRRWVLFSACVQHPAVQHLWIKACLGFAANKAQSLASECIFLECLVLRGFFKPHPIR